MSADLVCASQGVPLTIPAINEARKRDVPIVSMTKLFFDLWPGPILGITGSSGKTTTTSLVDAIFSAAGRPHVLGGNIGVGLMTLLDRPHPNPLPEGEGTNGGPLPEAEGTSGGAVALRGRTSRSPAEAGKPRLRHENESTWAVLEISHTQLNNRLDLPDLNKVYLKNALSSKQN